MPSLWRHLREDLVLVNGHLLDQVLRRCGILVRSPQGAWDHIAEEMLLEFAESAHPLFRNDSIVQGSAQKQRTWKTVDTLRCRCTHNWYNFSNNSFCQSAQCLRSSCNLKTIKIERGNLWYWWDTQLFLVKSKQKLLSMVKIPWMTKSFGSNTFNKLNRFQRKTEWGNSVRKENLCVLLKLDNISWPRTPVNLIQWLVATTPYQEWIKLLNRKDGFKEMWELDL